MYESKVAHGGACKKHICNGVDDFVMARGTKVVDMFIGATRKEVETSVSLLEVTKVILQRKHYYLVFCVYDSYPYNNHGKN